MKLPKEPRDALIRQLGTFLGRMAAFLYVWRIWNGLGIRRVGWKEAFGLVTTFAYLSGVFGEAFWSAKRRVDGNARDLELVQQRKNA